MSTSTLAEISKTVGISREEIIEILTPVDTILGHQEELVSIVRRITDAIITDGPSDVEYTHTQYNQPSMQISQVNFLKHFILAMTKTDTTTAEEEVAEFIKMFPITENHPIVQVLKEIIVGETLRKSNKKVHQLISNI